VHETFLEFIRSPDRETYRKLREWFIGCDAYDPYHDDLLDIERMVAAEQYDRAARALDRSMPNLLLSPRAHRLAAAIAEHQGNHARAEQQRAVADACVEGILGTGDGSRQHPYQVLHTADEYDVLDFLGQQSAEQRLHHAGDRHLDWIRTADGADIWFDVTDAYEKHSPSRVLEQIESALRDPEE
jgi:hypothetical protein